MTRDVDERLRPPDTYLEQQRKTVLLMAGFPVLLLLLTYALFLLFAGFTGTYYGNDPMTGYFIWAGDALARAWPFAIAGAILWFGIAYAFLPEHHRCGDGCAQGGARGRTQALQSA